MKNLIIAIIGTTLLAFSANAQYKKASPANSKTVTTSYYQPSANSFLNEVDLNLSEGYIKTYKSAGKSITDMNVFAAYSYDLGNNIQVGADVGLQSVDSTTRLTLAGTGTYNMDLNYSNSVFFKGAVGLYPVDKGTTSVDMKNEFGLYVSAGKRFKIWDHMNYKPMLTIGKIGSQDATISVQFLNISVNFN